MRKETTRSAYLRSANPAARLAAAPFLTLLATPGVSSGKELSKRVGSGTRVPHLPPGIGAGLIVAALLTLAPEAIAKRPDACTAASALARGACRLHLIPEGEEEAWTMKGGTRRSSLDDRVLAIYHTQYTAQPAPPATMALEYFAASAESFGIQSPQTELAHLGTTETPGGLHVRFQQVAGDLPVYRSRITVNLDRDNRVTSAISGYKPYAETLAAKRLPLSPKAARRIAWSYLGAEGKINHEDVELVLYSNTRDSRLAYRVIMVPAETLFGDWEVLVDAATGEVFRVEDRSARADGQGKVFDPDPLTRARADYGDSGFTDNSDADSPQLSDQLVDRALPDITFSANVASLTGPLVVITDFDSPLDGTFYQTGSTSFQRTRGDAGFEAVMAYHHIGQSLRYADSLGYTITPTQYTGGVQVDPHAEGGLDNSRYYGSTGRLAFGEGGVDDAEDPDVLLHELGHAIHDWLTDGNLCNNQGVSEAFGDYWAVSYNRSTGFWDPNDPEYNWVFHWDGHNEFWPGRITNTSDTYPGGLSPSIHQSGQMLSSTLMRIWEEIGREKTDRIALEAWANLNDTCTQQDVANMIALADVTLYDARHFPVICRHLEERGYEASICDGPFKRDLWIEDTPHDYGGSNPDSGDEPDSNMAGESMWKSRGMWVRNHPGQPGTYGDHRDHDDPEFGQDNEVYVTVRNRGGTSGVTDAVVEVYFADASAGLDWDPDDPQGGPLWTLIDKAAVGSVAPGEAKTLTVVWKKEDIPDPDVHGDHFCLIARLVSADDAMTFPEVQSINVNTRQNNNIAWRNVAIVNNVKKVSDTVRFLARNIERGTRQISLQLRGHQELLRDGGQIYVDLDKLFPGWERAGGNGSGIEIEGSRIRLLEAPATLSAIPLSFGDEAPVRVTARTEEPVPGDAESRRYFLDVIQLSAGREVGGMGYAIDVRAAGADTDGDGILDVDDPDDDNDGLEDGSDPEPLQPRQPFCCPVGYAKALARGLHYPTDRFPTCAEAIEDAESPANRTSAHYIRACRQILGRPHAVLSAGVVDCRVDPPGSSGNIVVDVEVCCSLRGGWKPTVR